MARKSLNSFHYESPDNLKYWFDGRVRSHSGIGLHPLKFIEDFGPNQKGSTVRDWSINPRTVSMDVFLQGEGCCDTRGEQLAELIDIIRPNRGTTSDVPGWLRFLNDNMEMMEIPVHVLQGPSGDYDYGGDTGKYQVLDTVQFYAADPIWREYKKNTIIVDFNQDLVACLPNCLPIETSKRPGICLVAATYTNQDIYINYDGTWDGDQIDIKLTGPITLPVVENITLGKRIELNYDIPSGDYVTITIRPETVTVIDNHGTNLIGTVTSISDLVDFVIKSPGSITPTGINHINITGLNSSLATTAIQIDYWVRHISAYGAPQC